MKFAELKAKKTELFNRIMQDKYNKETTPDSVIKEYRFLQREEKRMAKGYKKVS